MGAEERAVRRQVPGDGDWLGESVPGQFRGVRRPVLPRSRRCWPQSMSAAGITACGVRTCALSLSLSLSLMSFLHRRSQSSLERYLNLSFEVVASALACRCQSTLVGVQRLGSCTFQ